MSELMREWNNSGSSAENLAEPVKTLDAGSINNQSRKVLVKMFAGGKITGEIIKEKWFEQVWDTGVIEKNVDEIIANNQNQVNAYRSGNENLLGFLSGKR